MTHLDRPVVVYAFQCLDVDLGARIVPPFKATRHAIEHQFNGEALDLTGETVDASELDHEGRWFRLASGWASL